SLRRSALPTFITTLLRLRLCAQITPQGLSGIVDRSELMSPFIRTTFAGFLLEILYETVAGWSVPSPLNEFDEIVAIVISTQVVVISPGFVVEFFHLFVVHFEPLSENHPSIVYSATVL